MRPLPKPTIQLTEVLTDCISGTLDAGLKLRLESIRSLLVTVATDYDDRAATQTLHLTPHVASVGSVSAQELKDLYSTHLSATRGMARSTYDTIRNAAPNKRCPLCGAGTIAALDHHLPKSKFPDLAITPTNLVPACHYCNDSKKARYPKTAMQQTLHPYYDGHLVGQWLAARVVPGPPLTVTFHTVAPPGWSPTDVGRAARHLFICKLGVMYASNAADELGPLRTRLVDQWGAHGEKGVRAYLKGEVAAWVSRPNSWQHALYQALHTDDAFIRQGFLEIAT